MKVLVAGTGNIFRGDDGFGSVLAERLARARLPPQVTVTDYGLRSLHLAYELMNPPDLLIVLDALPRGQAPGTLSLLEADRDHAFSDARPDAFGVALLHAFAMLRELGRELPRILVIGCEPAEVVERLGLSSVVEAALPSAIELVRRTLERELATPAVMATAGAGA